MGLETFLEASAWAEFEGFSNNLFLRAIEGMDMGDEAYASWPTSRACSTRKPTRLLYRWDVLASACRFGLGGRCVGF